MMTTTKKRLEAMERHFLADDGGPGLAVFLHVDDGRLNAQPIGPIDGWKYDGHEIKRLPGESDDALKQRCIDEVKPLLRPMAAAVFLPVGY